MREESAATSSSTLAAAIGVVIRGFAMGSADVVPGVSGGTVAFVTGIYERLVAAVSDGSRALESFIRGRFRDGWARLRSIEWSFLLPLLVGAGIAVITFAGVIVQLLEDQPIRMAGLFLGLIGGTVVVAWRLLRSPTPRHVLIAVTVGLVSFFMFGLQSSAVVEPSPIAFLLSGMVAIVAFILPGISGSFILLSIGMYQQVIGAVDDRELGTVVVFGIGAVIGLAVFSRILNRLLTDHHDSVVAVLVGLMLGSVRILWPWPNGLGDKDGLGAVVLGAPRGDVAIPILLAVIGGAAVIGFMYFADRQAAGSGQGQPPT